MCFGDVETAGKIKVNLVKLKKLIRRLLKSFMEVQKKLYVKRDVKGNFRIYW